MNNIYDSARVRMLTAQLYWPSIKLVVSAWSGIPLFNASHQTVGQLKSAVIAGGTGYGAEVGKSMPINWTGVTSSGIAQTDQVLFNDIAVGESVSWLTLSEQVSPHDSSKLIMFVDEAKFLPFHGNGLDLIVQPDWLEGRGWFKP